MLPSCDQLYSLSAAEGHNDRASRAYAHGTLEQSGGFHVNYNVNCTGSMQMVISVACTLLVPEFMCLMVIFLLFHVQIDHLYCLNSFMYQFHNIF